MGFKAILAKPPSKTAFLNALKQEMKKAGEPAKRDFEKTTGTWENKPEFNITVKELQGNEIELFVGVESNWRKGQQANANDIYMFVTRGTSVRHALMSPDFQPKTKPRVIGSSGGRGGVIRVSKAIELPGIEPREWEETITKKNKSQIVKDTQKALNFAAKQANWTFR